MAVVSLNTIKNWFKTGLKPTQAQFWATWDSFRHKSDKVPFNEIEGLDAVLLAQNAKIDNVALPDTVIETGIVYVTGLTVDIIASAFTWRLSQVQYLNTLAYNNVMPAATDGYMRTDIFVGTNLGTIYRVQGPEAIGVAVKLPAPDGTVELASVDIEGAVVSEPVVATPNGKVVSVNGKKGVVVLDKADIGLGNVSNTSDANKPVSTAQQSALNLKLDASAYNDRFKGVHLTEAALNTAYPTANAGDSAQVNEVGATDVLNYNWDAEVNIWVPNAVSSSGATNTDQLPEGTSNLYFNTARVLAALLTGISFVTGGAIVSTDSVLVAFGKLQKQINDNVTAIGLNTAKVSFDSTSSTRLAGTSGANTGDETVASLKSKITDLIGYASADETTPMTTGLKNTFRMPWAMNLTNVRINTTDAPTISSFIVDIKQGGISIFSTLIRIDAGMTTSVGSTVPFVLSTTALTDNSIVTIHVTQIGSGAGVSVGTGLKVHLYGNKI